MWPITEDIKVPTHYPLTTDKIRFNGDAVAVVVARRASRPRTPPRRSTVDATALPAVTDLEDGDDRRGR